ncbi:hypothetical protein Tco_0934141 [Tanacetum coccineum]
MIKVLQERGFGSLPNSTKTNPMDHVKSIPTTVEDDMTPIRHIRLSQYVVSAQQNIVESMDSYRDQDMGDVIFGQPFCKASCVKARRFDELITIHNADGISYPYQKLKSFYMGVLNLGPNYRDALRENVIRGHISVHEMK